MTCSIRSVDVFNILRALDDFVNLELIKINLDIIDGTH